MRSAIEISMQAVLRRELLELRAARAIVPSSFTTSASTPAGVQPGEPGEVDRRLGVAGALEHAALAVPQREDVAGPGEVVGAWSAGSMSACTVVARSAAEMPVVVPCGRRPTP